jgi:hypothetical protein
VSLHRSGYKYDHLSCVATGARIGWPGAERLYFQAQGLSHAFQSELRRAVQRLIRDGDQAADGADIDDVATALGGA